MLNKIKNHRHIGHFILYAVTLITYGSHLTGLGPFIPYLAAETGIVQTEYSFLFSCRSFTMVVGVFFNKYFQKKQIGYHNIIIIGLLMIGIFSCLFSFTLSSFWLGFWLSLSSIGYAFIQITVNVCLLMVNNPEELEFWMLLAHGMFGIGGLLGPYLIYIFQQASYAIFGLFIVTTVPFYLRVKSPEKIGLQKDENPVKKQDPKAVSKTLEYSLCILMFFCLGMEITFAGWISSFATLSKVTDAKGATVFPSIYWVSMTFFRIFLAFLPGSSSKKLKNLIIINMSFGVLCLAVIYAGYVQFTCYLSSLLFGLSMSILYPLILVFPIEAGLALEDTQTSNIIMTGVISEGILTMFVGWLMELFHVNMLFYSLTFFALLMWFIRRFCLHLMDQQIKSLNENELGIELQEKAITLK